MLEVSVIFSTTKNGVQVNEVTLDLDDKGLEALRDALRKTPPGSWTRVDSEKGKLAVPFFTVRRRFDPPSRRS